MEKGFQLRNYHVRRGKDKDNTPLYPITKAENIIGGAGGVTQVTELPTTGEEGKIYYNTTDKKYYLYDGTSYSPIDSTGAGKSAYDVAVDEGFDGDETAWLASLKGAKGDTGDTGPQGPAGPQGNSGVASADEVIVVNNLTEGGTDVEVDGVTKVKVLSAEMGKELNKTKVGISENDKVILNQPILNLYGVENEDYWLIDGYTAVYNGEITASETSRMLLIKMRGTVLTGTGIALSYTSPWWTTDTKPSLSNPAVDDNGDPVSYSKGFRQQAVTNVTVNKAYVLCNVAKSNGEFKDVKIAFYSSFPDTTEQYRVKSLNNGKNFVASNLLGVSPFTTGHLDDVFAERINKLDASQYLDGYQLSKTSTPSIVVKDGCRILLQEIPSGLTNILVSGQVGVGNYDYQGAVLVDENLTIKKSLSGFGTSIRHYVFTNIPAEAKYLVLNLSGDSLPYTVDDLFVTYNVNTVQTTPGVYPYYSYLHAKRNEPLSIKHSVEYEEHPINQINVDNLTSWSKAGYYTFEFPVDADEKYMFWHLPWVGYSTDAENFVQYDENNEVLKKIAPYSVVSLLHNKYDSSNICLVRLEDGCKKVRFKFAFTGREYTIVPDLIAAGHKIWLLKDRVVPWRNPRVVSIDGIELNHNVKNPLEGLTICCFGDSITDFGSGSANSGYPWYIQSHYDCACINYGRGSAHFIDYSGTDPTFDENPGTGSGDVKNVVSTQIRWCIREMTEEGITPDVAIINGGTNDCYGTVNYGSLETSLATFPDTNDAVHTNFYDCVCYFVSKLREAFPNIKIFLSTVTKTLSNDSHETPVLEWNQHIFDAAEALGLSVIDFHSGCEISRYPKGTYDSGHNTWTHSNPWFNAGESLHLSQKGVEAMAKLAISEISKAFPT